MFSFHTREAIRVKVKKCEGRMQPEYRKFSVDPQITSFEVLQSLLARAFDVKGEFTVSYLARDDMGQEAYLSLLSDWDLDAAFLSSSHPCLRLKVDLRPFEEGLEDWDIIAPVDFPFAQAHHNKDRITIAGSILNQVERTFNMVQRALNLVDGEAYLQQHQIKPLKNPMNDAEFHNFLDSDGRLIRPKDLRISIYRGGLEHGLRKVVWKHILNVYPEGLSGADRVDYMKRQSKEYHRLRDIWQKAASSNSAPPEDMQTITNMVRKDVLRTDRTHKFYAGSDDNKNVVSLFSVLTTFALNHPSVSYCQGMSDLASPLLVTMRDEAHSYVCFCALMKRLRPNFMLDGRAMTVKFQHLTEALQIYDPVFYDYLQRHGADDLLFCYRWLLLELKREFAFEDALRMLEVLWSSLPPDPPSGELELFEVEFDPKRNATATAAATASSRSTSCSSASPSPNQNFCSKENPYSKVRAMRRQSSSSSAGSARGPCARNSSGSSLRQVLTESQEEETEVQDGPSSDSSRVRPQDEIDPGDESAPDYPAISTPMSRELKMDLDVLNTQLPGRHHHHHHYNRNHSHCLRKTNKLDSEELESSDMNDGRKVTVVKEENGSTSASDSDEIRAPNVTAVVRRSRRKKDGREGRKSDVAVKRSERYDANVKPDPNCSKEEEECNSFLMNGEIFENTEDDDDDVVFDASLPEMRCHYHTSDGSSVHLRGVVPIRLVRERSPRSVQRWVSMGDGDAGSTTASDSEVDHPSIELPVCRNISEGYATSEDAFCSSQETACRGGNDEGPNFGDSGVAIETPAMTNSCEEALENLQYPPLVGESVSLTASAATGFSGGCHGAPALPPPAEFGGGNPFMIFLCLTLLLQHRDFVMKNRMDYNELAMHFDKMVRRHNVSRVLNQARALFADYLKRDIWTGESGSESSAEFQDPNV